MTLLPREEDGVRELHKHRGPAAGGCERRRGNVKARCASTGSFWSASTAEKKSKHHTFTEEAEGKREACIAKLQLRFVDQLEK